MNTGARYIKEYNKELFLKVKAFTFHDINLRIMLQLFTTGMNSKCKF